MLEQSAARSIELVVPNQTFSHEIDGAQLRLSGTRSDRELCIKPLQAPTSTKIVEFSHSRRKHSLKLQHISSNDKDTCITSFGAAALLRARCRPPWFATAGRLPVSREGNQSGRITAPATTVAGAKESGSLKCPLNGSNSWLMSRLHENKRCEIRIQDTTNMGFRTSSPLFRQRIV